MSSELRSQGKRELPPPPSFQIANPRSHSRAKSWTKKIAAGFVGSALRRTDSPEVSGAKEEKQAGKARVSSWGAEGFDGRAQTRMETKHKTRKSAMGSRSPQAFRFVCVLAGSENGLE